MNTILSMGVGEWWQLAGWTMLHFLWLGTLAGVVAAMCRFVLRRAPANVRYTVALGWLALLAALPVGIAVWVGAKPQAEVVASRDVGVSESGIATLNATNADPALRRLEKSPSYAVETPSVVPSTTTELPRNASTPPNFVPQITQAIDAFAKYLPWLWLIGTPLTFALLATGVVGAERLRRGSRVIGDGPVAESCQRLMATLRIGRRVTVAVCERIATPVLVGIVRPIVLLPPAALTGWSPEEIEMVLLHELAHVRRWDNLVNLVQRIVESLLFFHPAVWLVSTWVRREREACCDAVVVGRTNRPHAYAELLVALAAQMPRSVLFHPAASSAMAAGPLRGRIRRILGLEDDPLLISGKSLGVVMSGLLFAVTLAVLSVTTSTQAEEEQLTADDTVRTEKEIDAQKMRATTQNNLKDLAIALLNYESANKRLPARAQFANGEPLLSWRVLVLPYLSKGYLDPDSDEAKLYNEFRLDEPWHSEHNRKLIGRMPAVFKNPQVDKPGMTNYLAVVGRECMFDDAGDPVQLMSVADGTSHTIAIVEADADRAVEWTKPEDWEFDREHPTAGLGGLWPDRWYAAWADGSIRSVSNKEKSDHVGIQFTRAGGETDSLTETAGIGGEMMGGRGEMGMGAAPATDAPVKKFPTLEEQKPERGASRHSMGFTIFYGIPFEVGASRFADGDAITITGVKGSSATFEPGNVYQIHGTYTLASRDRASIAAFVTARKAEDGRSVTSRNQTMTVERGSGTFMLEMPMNVRGWPHVSFYPAEGGASFGGVYVGTGDSVQEDWSKVYGPDDTRRVVIEGDGQTATAESEPDRLRLQIRRTQGQSGKFPSLEDQKLADLAWKRMGLELEPIGEQDLQRVKALGYEGGVKVANIQGHPGGILPSDILVGLHVWPTTDLAAVAELLDRDDLAELNPLKFYVVRQPENVGFGGRGMEAEGRGNAGFGGRRMAGETAVRDAVVTGRISVQVMHPVQPSMPKLRPRAAQEAPRTPVPQSGPAEDAALPDEDLFGSEVDSTREDLYYDGKTFDEWRALLRRELSTEKRMQAVLAITAFGASGHGKEAAESLVEIAPQYSLADWFAVFAPVNASEGPGRALLREILDALSGSVGGQSPYKIPSKDSTAALTEAARSDDLPRRQFAIVALSRIGSDEARITLATLLYDPDPGIRKMALQFYTVFSRPVEPGIEHLRKVIEENESPETVALARDALAALEKHAGAAGGFGEMDGRGVASGGDEANVEPAIDNAGVSEAYSNLAIDDLLPLLLHQSEPVQDRARRSINSLRINDPTKANKLATQLRNVLIDPNRSGERIAAIRALAVAGDDSKETYLQLEKLMMDRNNAMPIRIAAMKALERITLDGSIENRLRDDFIDANKDRRNTPEYRAESHEFQQSIRAESRALP